MSGEYIYIHLYLPKCCLENMETMECTSAANPNIFSKLLFWGRSLARTMEKYLFDAASQLDFAVGVQKRPPVLDLY